MGIIDSMKRAIDGTKDWLRGGRDNNLPPPTAPSTARYLHVSKPITEDMDMAIKLDLPWLADRLMRDMKGVTYHSARRKVKLRADDMARTLGMNNKQRRHLRSKMVAHLEANYA